MRFKPLSQPLFVGGNSRGDLEMMNESVGIKLIVNLDNKTIQTGIYAGKMDGYSVKQYWDKHNGITVYCKDIPENSYHYITQEWKIQLNKSNPKP